MTRACWQGLSFIRFVCERVWGVQYKDTTEAIMRGGHKANPYFEEVYRGFNKSTRKTVRYYRQFWSGFPLTYVVCSNGIRTVYEGSGNQCVNEPI